MMLEADLGFIGFLAALALWTWWESKRPPAGHVHKKRYKQKRD